MESKLDAKPTVWLGIDQSYGGFGFVVLEEDGSGEVECWDFTKNKKGDAERLLVIFDMLVHKFWELERKYTVVMAMEGYAHGAKFNREKLGELGGIVKLAFYDVFKQDPIIVPPTVLKKFVTGKGNASKDEMIKGVTEKWSTDIKGNHNIADAYGLARYVKENK